MERPGKKRRIHKLPEPSTLSNNRDQKHFVAPPEKEHNTELDSRTLAPIISYLSEIAALQSASAKTCQRISHLQLPHRLKSLHKLDVQDVLLIIASIWEGGRMNGDTCGYGWIRKLACDYQHDHEKDIIEPSQTCSHEYLKIQDQVIVGNCNRAVVVLSFMIAGMETACAVAELEWDGDNVLARVYRTVDAENEVNERTFADAVRAATECACFQWAKNCGRYKPKATSTAYSSFDYFLTKSGHRGLRAHQSSLVHLSTILTAWALLSGATPKNALSCLASPMCDEIFVWTSMQFFNRAIQGRLTGSVLSSFFHNTAYVKGDKDRNIAVPSSVMINPEILRTLILELFENPSVIEPPPHANDESLDKEGSPSDDSEDETVSMNSDTNVVRISQPSLLQKAPAVYKSPVNLMKNWPPIIATLSKSGKKSGHNGSSLTPKHLTMRIPKMLLHGLQ